MTILPTKHQPVVTIDTERVWLTAPRSGGPKLEARLAGGRVVPERCSDPSCIACQCSASFACNATEARIRRDERRLIARRTRAELAQARAITATILDSLARGRDTGEQTAALRRALVRFDSLLTTTEDRAA